MSDDPADHTTSASQTSDADEATTGSTPEVDPPASSPNPDEATPADVTAEPHADVRELSYETARDELASIVARLEGGSLDLEESMRLWERGEALAAHCSRWLDGAQARLSHSEDTPVD